MSKSALIIVDMVRDFTDPEGLVYYPQNREILPQIRKVLDKCREKGVLVVFMQHCNRKGKVDRKAQAMRPNCIEGTFGVEIDSMLPVDEEKDYVIQKRRYSGFFGTDLDLVLRENGVENVIIVGTKTNCCIRATVTDAFYLDYNPYVVKECVATNSEVVNEVHLTDIDKYLGDVVDMNTLFTMLDEGKLYERRIAMEIICYLSNGYPTIEASYNMAMEYADAGCKMMEVDFPSRNPYLESDYIAGRMEKALESCDDYEKYMDSIVAIKNKLPDVKILVLAYENTVEEIGTQEFIDFCLDNDLKDILLVGLKDDTVKDEIIAAGLQVSCYVQFHMPDAEIDMAKQSNGFVYLQAKPYATQEKNAKYPTLKDCVEHLRACGIDRPIYCGVGVHAPEDVKLVKEAGGDAAFVGSTILKLHEDIPAMKEKIREFKAKC